MPLILCIQLSTNLSQVSMVCTLACTSKAFSPNTITSPSFLYAINSELGSTCLNIFSAITTPAKMPSCFIFKTALPFASGFIQLSVLWSPSPISSCKACTIKCSSCSSNVFIPQIKTKKASKFGNPFLKNN